MFTNNSERSEPNNSFMSKRNIDEIERNGTNNTNNSWIDNSFDHNINKRPKAENRWTPQMTNSIFGANNSQFVSQNCEEMDEDFDDGLDVLISQAVDQNNQLLEQTSGYVSDVNLSHRLNHSLDQNMSQIKIKSSEDIAMSTAQSYSNESSNSEESQGKLIILESRCKKLDEEVHKYRIQNVQSNHRIKELESHSDSRFKQLTDQYESSLHFERNEREMQKNLMSQLYFALKQVDPNSPILKTSSEWMNTQKHSKKAEIYQNFSQLKLKEFYAPLSCSTGIITGISTQTQNTPLSCGEIIVSDTQSTIGAKRFIPTASFPSQILATQSTTDSPMDTTFNEPMTQNETNNCQNQTQSQRKMIWNTSRAILEHKYNEDQQILNQLLFMEPNKEFDDQWIRDSNEINNFVNRIESLTQEFPINLK